MNATRNTYERRMTGRGKDAQAQRGEAQDD